MKMMMTAREMDEGMGKAGMSAMERMNQVTTAIKPKIQRERVKAVAIQKYVDVVRGGELGFFIVVLLCRAHWTSSLQLVSCCLSVMQDSFKICDQ